MSELKKEYKTINRNGNKIKLMRYEGDSLWQIAEDQLGENNG